MHHVARPWGYEEGQKSEGKGWHATSLTEDNWRWSWLKKKNEVWKSEPKPVTEAKTEYIYIYTHILERESFVNIYRTLSMS